jgi:4-amino-4-deoxy-L-arabinose transferase-like glycosyltransferase
MKPRPLLILAIIVIIGLAARLPGVYWGSNFPAGWESHHPDEFTHWTNTKLLLNPSYFGTWRPHPYPKGLAATVAVPALAVRKLNIRGGDWPYRRTVTVAGRLVSVAFGVATILVLVLITNLFFNDRRVGLTAGLILALGGLHVTQSHFFVSDVAAQFWLLLGLYLLLRELTRDASDRRTYLGWAAFCMGAAFGMKLVVAALPTLALIVLLRRPRLARTAHTAVFFLAGFVAINFASYTPHDLYRTLRGGVSDPSVYNRLTGILLYIVELPSIVSLPVAVLGLIGGLALVRHAFASENRPRLPAIVLIAVLPLLVHAYFVAMSLDHFPRHLIPVIPWLALAAGWSLVKLGDRIKAKGVHPGVLTVPFFLYLAAFVYDGERVFITEPRNEAASWILNNVPSGTTLWWRGPWFEGYEYVRYPMKGKPSILVIDMKDANHYLRGMTLRDSFPEDSRNIFDSFGQDWVESMQAVFRGTSGYREVARFSEGYVMPEYVVTDRLIGNRSRNYVAEIVVFHTDQPEGGAITETPPNAATE